MSSFHDACKVEAKGVSDICRFLEQQCDCGRFVLTDKGRLSETLQRTVGDAVASKNDGVWGIEFKVERENKHGNFFLETWSNLAWRKPGWMFTLDADVLLYYFLAEREMYAIPFQRLCKWAFGDATTGVKKNPGRIYDFPERLQAAYLQRNDTWGRCVPIAVIETEVTFTRYSYDIFWDEWTVTDDRSAEKAFRMP